MGQPDTTEKKTNEKKRYLTLVFDRLKKREDKRYFLFTVQQH